MKKIFFFFLLFLFSGCCVKSNVCSSNCSDCYGSCVSDGIYLSN